MELKEAKKLLANRTEYINSAKREAEAIKKQAQDEARQMVAEDQLLNQARQKSNEMIRLAEERSRELRRVANEYCEDALRRTEEAVSEAVDEIRQSRARFRAAAGQSAQSGKIYDAAADEN
jgi:F0F1-type ATP synthase membrane subunit b/b'